MIVVSDVELAVALAVMGVLGFAAGLLLGYVFFKK